MSHAGERLRRFALSGYILAFVSVGAAFVLSLMLLHLDSPLPFTGFALPAIAITFWRGRTGPGILEERFRAIGGRLEIDSTSEGTPVRVTVPLGEERM